MVTHAYNPSYLGGEDQEVVQGQPGRKVPETPSQPIKAGVLVHSCHSRYAENLNRRIVVEASLGINFRPH
jgi:hypothetical protein